LNEDFNYPASSSNSQSVPVNYRLSAEAHRVFVEIFDSHKFPYRTVSDMHRHADHRLMEWLSNQSTVKHNTDYLRAMNIALNAESEIIEFQHIFDDLRTKVHFYQENGMQEDAGRIVKIILNTVAGMPNTQLKKMYQQKIESEFGHYAGRIVEGVKVEMLVSQDPEDTVNEEG